MQRFVAEVSWGVFLW